MNIDLLQANKHELRFLNLTCYLTEEERDYKNEENYSTHDSAETMIYAYVDTHPTVADLIWKKRQLKQSEFLSLTAPLIIPKDVEKEEISDLSLSTHQPLLTTCFPY